MSLPKLSTYSPKELEAVIQAYWDKEKIPAKTQTKKAKRFFLLDGPPYTNAQPHVGHVKTTACKDIWPKYKQMNGFSA